MFYYSILVLLAAVGLYNDILSVYSPPVYIVVLIEAKQQYKLVTFEGPHSVLQI